MTDKLKKIFDPTFFRFIVVGVINTLVGYGVMFGLYNLAGLHTWGDAGYWISSAANYIIGSIVSFFLNKHFTFQNKERGWAQVGRFALTVAVCWLIAYGVAKPLALWALSGQSGKIQENVALLVGMVLYTGLNYFGQRFFAFRKKNS